MCGALAVRLWDHLWGSGAIRSPLSLPGGMQEHLRSSQGSVANKEALGDRQCGFIKGRSCLKYLVAFYGRVTALVDRGRAAGVIYLDLVQQGQFLISIAGSDQDTGGPVRALVSISFQKVTQTSADKALHSREATQAVWLCSLFSIQGWKAGELPSPFAQSSAAAVSIPSTFPSVAVPASSARESKGKEDDQVVYRLKAEKYCRLSSGRARRGLLPMKLQGCRQVRQMPCAQAHDKVPMGAAHQPGAEAGVAEGRRCSAQVFPLRARCLGVSALQRKDRLSASEWGQAAIQGIPLFSDRTFTSRQVPGSSSPKVSCLQSPLLLDVELLLENSKGPESRNLNSLHTEKTERLTREFLRDGKRDDCQSRGTLLCALPAPEGQWGKVGHFGKLWRRAASSVSFVTPLQDLPPSLG